MSLLTLLVVVVVVCLLWWLIQTYVPVPLKMVLSIALVLIFCLWLLQAVGVIGGGSFLRLR